MPNYLDFNKVKNIKAIDIEPIGWINPITIIYGDYIIDDIYHIAWKVRNTKHVFVIKQYTIDNVSSGDYKAHFEKFLEIFKEDFLKWKKEYPNIGWVKEYEEEYRDYLLY